MKILVLSTKMPWPPRDGGAIATLNLALGLARNGAEVTLLAMNTGKHYFPPERIPSHVRELIQVISVPVDTRIRPFELLWNFLFSSRPYIADRFASKPFRTELVKCLAGGNFDIVQMEGPYLYGYTRFIGKGPLLSLRAHNLEHRIWEIRARKAGNPFRKLYMRSLSGRIFALEKALLGTIDMLVPISDPDADGFSRIREGIPVMVCRAGLNLADYPSGNADEQVRLFYIGALDWGPNQEGLDWFFKKVWPEMHSRWPELDLHVAGRNSSRYFKGDPPPGVFPEGEVEDAIQFYSRHSVMIAPLLSGSGIRIKILEAMAMGRIVISSAVGADGIGARDGEHLFIADKPGEYLKVLEMLVNRPEIIREMGLKARRLVKENFDNLVLSEKLISFYKAQLA